MTNDLLRNPKMSFLFQMFSTNDGGCDTDDNWMIHDLSLPLVMSLSSSSLLLLLYQSEWPSPPMMVVGPLFWKLLLWTMRVMMGPPTQSEMDMNDVADGSFRCDCRYEWDFAVLLPSMDDECQYSIVARVVPKESSTPDVDDDDDDDDSYYSLDHPVYRLSYWDYDGHERIRISSRIPIGCPIMGGGSRSLVMTRTNDLL